MTAPTPAVPNASSDLSVKLPPLVPRRRTKPGPAASEPPPETPELPPPPDLSKLTFTIPTRRILSTEDHDLFLSSPTYSLILAFIFGLADSVRCTAISTVSNSPQTPMVTTLMSILDEAQDLISSYPPEDTGSRFGNPAFRFYFDGIAQKLAAWHAKLSLPAGSEAEIGSYLQHSVGSAARLDYGSGHELNFALWLLCLNRVGRLPPATFPALALVVFPRYLRLVRAVQSAYYLEPAGSHGVWGLDDYQFLPFLLGAAQLRGHKFITPRAIHSAVTLDEFRAQYLYLDQVAFVNSVKNVDGLRWHSPMLDDISAAKSWEKIEAGLKKMFVKEVLGKLPVMQHFLFGALVPAVEGMSGEDEEVVNAEVKSQGDHRDHKHNGQSWDDCCGIKVPGALAASEEMKKRAGGGGLRRLPFD